MELRKGFHHSFTLMELIVTIAIIGIIISLAVPSYKKQVLRSKFDEAYALIDVIAKAQERHLIEHGDYFVEEGTSITQNERFITNHLMINLEQFPNFVAAFEHTGSDRNYEVRVFLRPDNYGLCIDDTDRTFECKETNTTQMDDFLQGFTRSIDNHYITVRKAGVTSELVIDQSGMFTGY